MLAYKSPSPNTPNFFVRMGLFLLTVLAVACFLGLFMLGNLGQSDIGTLLIFFGILCYGALEFFIHVRKVHRSGVDDALLLMAGGLILGGINLRANEIGPSVQSLMILVLAGWGVLRYADRLMALVAYGALLSLLYYLTIGRIGIGRDVFPLVMLIVSPVFYLLFTRWSAIESLRHYHSSLQFLRAATLLSFYLGGNYYIVQQMSASIAGVDPLGWLWWTLTVIMPFAYILRGIRQKDTIFLWMGMALVAATVFTIRNYYHILPVELLMIAGGSILIVISYCLIRYLRIPKYGFTSMAPDAPHVLENLPIEGLILTEGFKPVVGQPTDPGPGFGGGSGGGGGAGGKY